MLLAWSGYAAAQKAPDSTISTESDAAVRRAVAGIVSYSRWPVPLSSVRLCVTGDTRLWRIGSDVEPQQFTPPIATSNLAADEPAPAAMCDALYLGGLSDNERRKLFGRIEGRPVLTIAEQDPTCTSGAMFCMNVVDARVTFDINLDSVSRSGVRVSPKVLELAHKLRTP